MFSLVTLGLVYAALMVVEFTLIVRTVRGVGYRFDRHADVSIRFGHGTPSPDRF